MGENFRKIFAILILTSFFLPGFAPAPAPGYRLRLFPPAQDNVLNIQGLQDIPDLKKVLEQRFGITVSLMATFRRRERVARGVEAPHQLKSLVLKASNDKQLRVPVEDLFGPGSAKQKETVRKIVSFVCHNKNLVCSHDKRTEEEEDVCNLAHGIGCYREVEQ